MIAMFRKVTISLIFLIGFDIFSYPIVSHWIKTKEHYIIISQHNEVLARMDDARKEAERKKAEKYNENISESSIPIEDPFAEGAQDNGQKGYYNVLNIGETIGHLQIPKINVNLPIYHGISEEVLSQGVGHMSNSSFPIGGKGSHTALTAHRGLPSTKLFRDLDQLQKDDLFFVKTLGDTLAYKVDDIQIVLPSETNWLSIEEDKDYVTLITCDPYMINTHRLLVRGERVPHEQELPEEILAEVHKDLDEMSQNINKSIFTFGIVVMFIIILGYAVRKRVFKGDAK